MSLPAKLIFVILIPAISLWAIPAFPGAEGWGADAVGGRGGQVIHVTNLNSYGAGSFSQACGQSGAKIIVFDVSGTINGNNNPFILSSNTTIAGQTSPGGITIINGGLYAHYNGTDHDIIIRHIRVRRSPDRADGDCFRLGYASKYILDHCSGMWNSDEVIDATHSHTGTWQYTIIAEPGECYEEYGSGSGYGNNRTGALLSSTDGRTTFYKCIFAHHMKRSPFLSNMGNTAPQGKTYELVNNVFYNCMAATKETFDYDNNIPLNQIGNYYKPGLNMAYPSSQPYAHSGSNPPKMYVHSSGNYNAQFPMLTVPQGFFNSLTVIAYVDTVIPPQKTFNISDVQDAYNEVLASAGPWPRDSADRRLVNEVRTGTGGWKMVCDVSPDPYLPGTGTLPTDSDGDGMPNAWETANGLNPNNGSDHTTKMNGGYDAIEVYINALADSLGGTTINYRPHINTIDGAPRVLAYPNPLNSRVCFSLVNMNNTPVSMKIYDVKGKLIYSAQRASNLKKLSWDGRNVKGLAMCTGIYMARFIQGNKIYEKRVSLLR